MEGGEVRCGKERERLCFHMKRAGRAGGGTGGAAPELEKTMEIRWRVFVHASERVKSECAYVFVDARARQVTCKSKSFWSWDPLLPQRKCAKVKPLHPPSLLLSLFLLNSLLFTSESSGTLFFSFFSKLDRLGHIL